MTIDNSQLIHSGPPLKGVILAASSAAVSCPADANEDVLAIIVVPANALGPNGVLRISTLWSMSNNANSKTIRVRYSGPAGAQYLAAGFTTAGSAAAQTLIFNRGANSQCGSGTSGFVSISPFGAGTVSGLTSAADTTLPTAIYITGQKAVGGDILTLESYLVELFAS
jgi:hypothetical protein